MKVTFVDPTLEHQIQFRARSSGSRVTIGCNCKWSDPTPIDGLGDESARLAWRLFSAHLPEGSEIMTDELVSTLRRQA